MKLSILVPVFNEEKTIGKVLEQLISLKIPSIEKEIIVINDGSTDNSLGIIQKYASSKVKVINFKDNYGKGRAIRAGLQKAEGDYILIQDADMEYSPSYIRSILEPILQKKSEVVYGTRLKRWPNIKKDERTIRFFAHYIGNKALSLLTSILFFSWITDMETGYKVFPKHAFEINELKSNQFEIEPEITVKLLKKGYSILEVAIQTNPRGYKEGKKLRTIPAGITALATIIKYRFIN